MRGFFYALQYHPELPGKQVKNLKKTIGLVIVIFCALAVMRGAALASDSGADLLRLKVDSISKRLEPFTGLSPKIVLSDEKALNAHVMPDRTVVITRGLIAACSSDDEIAFVIAHEIGHIKAKDYYTITPGLKSDDSASQLHEINADINAVFFTEKAGFNPNASLSILKRLSTGSNGTFLSRLNTLASFLKTLRN